MLRLKSVALLLGVGMVCPHPALGAPSSQVQAAAPIRIERCAVNVRSFLQDPFNGMRMNFVSGISLRFVNVRDVAATRVNISLHYQGATETMVAGGTFAAGDLIDRDVAAFSAALYAGPSPNCSVTSATFADGSTWSAGP